MKNTHTFLMLSALGIKSFASHVCVYRDDSCYLHVQQLKSLIFTFVKDDDRNSASGLHTVL